VRSSGEALFLQVGGNRVPLQANAGLTAGQSVQVEVLRSDSGVQLRLTPTPQSSSTTAPPPTTANSAVLQSAIQALGATRNLETLARILPQSAQSNADAVRQLLTLFLRPGSAGPDAQHLSGVLQGAMDAGVIPPTLGEGIVAQLSVLFGGEGFSAERLQRLAARARAGLEARIAQALRTGNLPTLLDQLQDDILFQLDRLRRDESLARHLAARGDLDAFNEAAERIHERLSGGRLQNLRALELPYFFFEVPMDGESGRAQVHIFGDGRSDDGAFGRRHAYVALDVSLSRIGDLWIGLSFDEGRCSCAFRSPDSEVRRTINEDTHALKEALADAGYPGATVHTQAWNGDRLDALESALRRLSGLSVNA
jgi:hypothetical protein